MSAAPPPGRVARPGWRWGYAGAAWALLFAGLHVYWALGGTVGLASSAGRELAADRPPWFVAFGLWGVALVLVGVAALGLRLALARGPGPLVLTGVVLGWLVGGALAVRGLGVEVLLATGAGGVARSVGPDQVRAGLVVWDPWFVLGGVVFLLAARQCDATRRAGRRP